MKPFRFLHAADLHLDSPFRGMTDVPSPIRNRVRESTFDALRQLILIAIRENADFVLISGDVYDLADRSLRAQIRFQQAMEELAEKRIPVYIAHGNHDPEDGRRASLSWPDKVHFFNSKEVETIPVTDRNGICLAHVHGISYPTSSVTANLAMQFNVKDPSVYNIGVLHANVDGDQGHDNYAPCGKTELIQSGMQYWALGHIHTRQVIHSEPHIVYPGNIQGRSVRETGPKGCYIVDVTETGITKLSFHPTDSLRWFDEAIAIASIRTEQELMNAVERHMEQVRTAAGGRPSIVRFTFQGRGQAHRWLAKGTHLQELLTELRNEQRRAAAEDEHAPFVWIQDCKVLTGLDADLITLAEQYSFIGDLLSISRHYLGHEDELFGLGEQAFASFITNPKAAKYYSVMSREEMSELLRAAEEIAIDLLLEEKGGAD